jgi:hypothetical protein
MTNCKPHRPAWDNRATLDAKNAELREAVEHVIAELDAGRLRVASARAWASGPCTSGSRRPCCCPSA